MASTTDTIDWRARARALRPRHQLFIDGRSVDAWSGATFDCISPVDGHVLAKVAAGDAPDVDVAVRSARAAFERGDWSRAAPKHRKQVLQRFAERVRAHAEELALTETLDMGKPIADSLAVDVPSTANCIQWYAEAVDKIYDQVAPTGQDSLALITREPLGVVGAIVPWNFPLIMAAWKLGPVLAAGNSIVLKPSEKSPLSALRIAELAIEAGLPPGVFNVVTGFGHTAGKALASHMDVDGIAFTGSTATGKLIMGYAAQSNLKRVSLEAARRPALMADWRDGSAARAAALRSSSTRAMCSAGSRLVVHEPQGRDAGQIAGWARAGARRSIGPGDAPGRDCRRAADAARTGLYPGRQGRWRTAGAGRCAGASRQRRLLHRANRVRRREAGHAHRPRGNLRASAGDADVPRRGRGAGDRQ
jgi:acyl-CoA reductase-like NAD-dependent aldehyde dehydrogenase